MVVVLKPFNCIAMPNDFTEPFQDVDSADFQELVQSGDGILLDVRTPEEFAAGHLEGATLIDVTKPDCISKINLLPKEQPIYIYCRVGSRSAAAADYMAKIGFTKLYNLQDGITDWHQRGLPVEQGDG